jgi:class 3 adenylate cyclase/predicted ATPase
VNFSHVLHAVIGLLVIEGRLSYRRLQAEFDLDDSQLDALRFELIEVKALAVDQQGEVLAWAGDGEAIVERRPRPALAGQPAYRLTEPAARSGATVASAPPLLEASLAAEPATSDAERRPLTVMFCDLADSTALSGKLDPEDLQDVIRAYQERCTGIVREYDGFVAKYMGDGILVYFGYPKSLERNAERAVRTGLAIVEAMVGLNAKVGRAKGIEIAVRIGIATGLVMVGEIVGEGLAQERAVIGEAPNVAARLQGLAGRNGIVIGALTREVAGDAFLYQELGSHELKGIAGRVQTWGVTGLRAERAEDADEAESESGAAPPALIGRDEETGLLRRAWQSTKDEGRGQVVLISGEAGIGKSVLVDGLRAEVRAEGPPRIAFRCSPYHTNSALYPVIEHLKRLLRWQSGDDAETRLKALEAMLGGYSQPLAEAVPLFASLVSLPLPEGSYPPLALSAQQQKHETQDALIAWMLEEAERQPLLTLWEDLHWADPSTLELIGLLIEQSPTAPLLMVLTSRPEFVPPWPARSHMTPITLNRLERAHSEALVARLAGDKPLPAEVVEHIVIKTDGVPLYVEELTKTILVSNILRETGERFELTGPLSSLAIPATLQESLMARLDRLPQVREVAQLGSVLGREFAYEMLSGLSTVGEVTLQEGLGQLVEAELLYQRGRPPRARYTFKHALVQDAAYQSLLRRNRQQYHQQVAELLERKFPDVVEAQPELLAHHYSEASATERAVAYWLKAGQRAARQSAHPEAIAHLRQGLAMLSDLADTPERAKQELAFQSTLGPVVMATQGYGSSEAARIYHRARELCQLVGDTEDIYPVLFGVYLLDLVRAKYQESIDVANELLEQAQHAEDAGARSAGHMALGVSLVQAGQPSLACQHFEQSLVMYDPDQHLPLAFRYGLEIGATANAYWAWSLWLRGYPDQALERSRQTLALLERVKHPYTESRGLYWNAVLHAFRREWPIVDERAAGAMRSAGEHGFALVLAAGQIVQGAAGAARGQGKVGLQLIQGGLEAYQASGAVFQRSYHLALLAEVLGAEGLQAEGLEALQEAAGLVETSGERFYEAEILRLKGELLLAASPLAATEAEACYRQALEVARRQEAISLELRAATSLARLWRDQGKPDAARELLASVYDWFTEGFDTADLKDAGALLHELAPLALA